MRKVSLWAAEHPWTARLLIIVLYVPLNIAGIITGDVFYDLQIILPGYYLLSLFTIVAIVAFCYSSHGKSSGHRKSYAKRKVFDLILGICTFGMICFTGNQLNVQHPFTLTTQVISVPVSTVQPSQGNSVLTSDDGKNKQKLIKKVNRKKVKTFLKQLRKKYKDLSDGEKILLVFLTIVVALALIALLAALACSIACAGSEVLAYVVFFLGTGAIAFFTVHVIHKIIRKRKKPLDKETVPAIPTP